MNDKVVIDGSCDLQIAESAEVGLSISTDGEQGVVTAIHVTDYPFYTGDTEFAPSAEAQVVHTGNTILTEDIVIDPIPQNYGLITWDGTILTVS